MKHILCRFNNTPTKEYLEMCYDKTNELIAKRILESNMPYRIQFKTNEDKYGVDLKCFYTTGRSELKETLIGYIEVEHCPQWITYEFPGYWEKSFLERKVHDFDYYNKHFLDTPRKNYDITYYIRCNSDFTSFIGTTVKDLYMHGWISLRSDRTNRMNSFIEVSPTYCNLGLKENVQGILEMLNDNATKRGLH